MDIAKVMIFIIDVLFLMMIIIRMLQNLILIKYWPTLEAADTQIYKAVLKKTKIKGKEIYVNLVSIDGKFKCQRKVDLKRYQELLVNQEFGEMTCYRSSKRRFVKYICEKQLPLERILSEKKRIVVAYLFSILVIISFQVFIFFT